MEIYWVTRLKRLVYVVDTIVNNEFIFVGTVTVDYQCVLDAVDATGDIAHNMPSKFARREAEKKYPKANPILVMPIDEWKQRYGNPKDYKRGDIVK